MLKQQGVKNVRKPLRKLQAERNLNLAISALAKAISKIANAKAANVKKLQKIVTAMVNAQTVSVKLETANVKIAINALRIKKLSAKNAWEAENFPIKL